MQSTAIEKPVREKSIPFKPEMVKAILEDRKTQTRRAISKQPTWDEKTGLWSWAKPYVKRKKEPWVNSNFETLRQLILNRCSFGQPGDHLWIKEPFGWDPDGPHTGPLEFLATYRGNSKELSWQHPNQMPRWASRILLEITSIRLDQLRDISQLDCNCEGVADRDEFRALWEASNFSQGFEWGTNPWVYVITFRRVF
jgi:hypothetical protein